MNRLILVAVAFASFAQVAHAEDVKIGYIDMQRALNEVEEGASAKKALKKEFDEKQKVIDEKQNKLKALKDELDARGNLMKPEVKQDKLNELQKEYVETTQTFQQLQQELSKREGDLTQEIFKKMGVVIQTMAEEGNYTLILERQTVLFGKPALDLTNELIRRYNDAYKKKK